MYPYRKKQIILFIVIFSFFYACRTGINFNKGVESFSKKNWDESVDYFIKALGKDPDNINYRLHLSRALISASDYHFKMGEEYSESGNMTQALFEYNKALENNPENSRARIKKYELLKKLEKLRRNDREKTELEAVKKRAGEMEPESPEERVPKDLVKIDFKSIELKHLFDVLEKTLNISFLFDEGFKSEKIRIVEKDITILELLDKIVLQSKIFYKIIDENTILIIPDTPAKRNKYEDLVLRTFFLSNSDPEDIGKMIKEICNIKSISINKTLNSLILKGRIDQVRLAEKIVEVNDKPKGELLIDIEIIEVNKKRVKEYGIDLSQYKVTQTYSPGSPDSTTSSVIRSSNIPQVDAADFLLSLPAINYKLLKSDQDSKIKARPHMRVVDGEDIVIRLGDKVPIPTTSFVPQYGGSTVNNQAITSYKMEEIGINIDLKPKIHHNGWITISMNFELTFVSSPGDIEKGTPPTIGNRTVKTLIRLKDNETTILAGLLRDTEMKSIRGFPIISKIPILKDLFSGNSKEVDQTDIILTLTPRIIRYPEIYESDLNYIWAGTFEDPGIRKSPPSLEEEKNGAKNDPKKKSAESELPKKESEKNTGPVIPEEKPERKKTEEKTRGNDYFQLTSDDRQISAGRNFKVILSTAGSSSKETMKVLKTEIEFDPEYLEIVSIGTGDGDRRISGNLFKTFDNASGRIELSFSFTGEKSSQEGQIAEILMKAKKSGITFINSVKFDVFDSKMKKVDVNPLTNKISIF